MSRRRPLDIAIVGMACQDPGAADLFAFADRLFGVQAVTTELGSFANLEKMVQAAVADAGLTENEHNDRWFKLIVRAGLGEAAPSTLVALDLGIRALTHRAAEVAVVGGILSVAEGSRSIGILILKRRDDAERDGDRVYSIVRGVFIANDGRSARRVYRSTGVDSASVISHQASDSGGIVGVIEAALVLHHRFLPPSWLANRSAKGRPWVQADPLSPRRAEVSDSGRPDSDALAILEEHPASNDGQTSPGAWLRWDSETILFSAPDRVGLVERIETLLAWIEGNPDGSLKDLAYTCNSSRPNGPCRLGLVARSLTDLSERLRSVLSKLGDPACRSIRDARGAYYRDLGEGPAPRLAFLFPGEGSQYPGMLADLCPHFPEVRALFDTSDRISRESGAIDLPSDALFNPPADGLEPGLWSAEVAVNVVLSAQWGIYQLLSRLGLRPEAMVGHSSGELLALGAAGVVAVDRGFEAKLGDLGAIFGRLETSRILPTARLVAVASSRERVEAVIGQVSGVEIAMDNCPHQVVIAGISEAVETAVGQLKAVGIGSEDLPFSRAYHTKAFIPALGPIAEFFDSLAMHSPRVPVYSCASEAQMPDDPTSIRRLAVEQWTKSVGFRGAIEAMHANGLDTFVDVGARGNLAGFVEDILRGRPALAIAANLPRRTGILQLNHLVAALFARGVEIDPGHLYARRRPVRLDLGLAPKPTIGKSVSSPTIPSRIRVPGSTAPFLPQPAHDRSGELARTSAVATLEVESDDPMIQEFQRTMTMFLRTQQEVMDAYLLNLNSVEDEIAFHVSDGADREVARPWSGVLISLTEGREAISHLRLDSSGDPVAEHHTLGGRRISKVHPDWRGLPILPFAVMAEILAVAAERLRPGWELVVLREVRAHRWIRYEEEPITLEIRAAIDPDRADSVRVAIHNRGPIRAMRALEPPVFEGIVAFARDRPDPPIAFPFTLKNPEPCRFTAKSIYDEQWLFHGPALQAVVGIGSIAMDGIEGTIRVRPLGFLLREPNEAGQLMTDPIVLDNFTHLLGAWGLDRLADDGDVIFPLGMGELAIFGDRPCEGSDIACRIAIRELDHHRVLADADLIRADGSIWMSLRGWEDWRFRWPGQYRDGFRQPDRTFLGEPLHLAGSNHRAIAVWLEPPGDMGRSVWRDVLEHVQLGPDERRDYLTLPGPDLRRTHRLWGRIAAKEAARRLRIDRGHPPEYPADLIVERDGLGRPSLRSRLEPNLDELPTISIAHIDGVAVALATDDFLSHPGIDVEPIVARSASFEATAFTSGERALLGSRSGDDQAEWSARFWCAKEAVAKATGLGFVDGPSGAEVVAVDADGSLRVWLRGNLALSCPELAALPIRVNSARRGGFAWAWTLGEGVES